MKKLVVALLFGAVCFAQDAQKPACNAHTQGRFWPEEANDNREVRRNLFQSGELEMCSLTVWRYKWQRVSVNAQAKRPASATAKTPPKPDTAR